MLIGELSRRTGAHTHQLRYYEALDQARRTLHGFIRTTEQRV